MENKLNIGRREITGETGEHLRFSGGVPPTPADLRAGGHPPPAAIDAGQQPAADHGQPARN